MDALRIRTRRGQDIILDSMTLEGVAGELRGELIPPTHPEYEGARRVWNGLIDHRPGLILRCAGVADVIRAVRLAREHDLLVSVRGGGHGVAGRAICDGGLVIDLSRMRGVRVDAAARAVRAEGGVRFADLDHETQAFGLAAPGGLVSPTGIGGLTLGGGMGWLVRKHGLVCDNLVAADVVTADGQLRRASADEEPDLFWALQGAGSNFGVVTSFEYALHPVGPEVWQLAVMYSAVAAKRVLRVFREHMSTAPEELGALAVFWNVPDEYFIPEEVRGVPAIVLVGCYTGPLERGEEALRPLREIGNPLVDLTSRTPYVRAQQFFDADYPSGGLYYWKSRFLKSLDDEVIDFLMSRCIDRPSSKSSVDLWALGGAFGRRRPADTAFGRRDAPFMLAVEANWTDPARTEVNVRWARELWRDAERYGYGGTYANFPGLSEEGESLSRATYGESYQRLGAIKRRYDPENLFLGSLSISPGE